MCPKVADTPWRPWKSSYKFLLDRWEYRRDHQSWGTASPWSRHMLDHEDTFACTGCSGADWSSLAGLPRRLAVAPRSMSWLRTLPTRPADDLLVIVVIVTIFLFSDGNLKQQEWFYIGKWRSNHFERCGLYGVSRRSLCTIRMLSAYSTIHVEPFSHPMPSLCWWRRRCSKSKRRGLGNYYAMCQLHVEPPQRPLSLYWNSRHGFDVKEGLSEGFPEDQKSLF